MGAMIHAYDWAASPLGPIDTWPTSLATALSIALNSAFFANIFWGPEFRLLYNDTYTHILMKKHPAALGQPAREVWSEIWDVLAPMFHGVVETGVGMHTTDGLLLMERSGYLEECYFVYNVSPIFGEDGRVAGLFNAGVETTDRVIGDRRTALQRALGHALVGIMSREQVYAAVDQAFATNRKDFPFSLIYLRDNDGSWSGHASTEDAAPLLKVDWPLDAIAAGVTEIPFALDDLGDLVPTGDWSVPPKHAMLVPIARNDSDEPLGALVLGLNPLRPEDRDMVPLGQVMAGQIAGALTNVEALEAANGRAQRLWTRSRDLGLVLDPNGTFRSVSPSWTTILGHAPEEVVGHHFSEFVYPEDAASTSDAYLQAANVDDLNAFENRYVSKSGEPRWISWNTTIEDGLIYAYGRDVTEAKAQAAALAVAEEALRQAQKMEAIGQLTGGVAHDFNNLLTVIRSATDLLRLRDLSDEKRKRYIDAISDTADRAAKLTGQLLAFARRQALRPEALDVGKAIAAIGDMAGTLTGSRIRFQAEISDEPCWINADPSQFDTAIINLIVNARDAMNSEGTLTIRVAPAPAVPAVRAHAPINGDFVSIAVADTGAGIDAETIKHIFEPFFTTKEVGQGTGLGLSQVFGFSKQSGGEVQVESEVGRGTTFTIYLPRVAAPDAAPQESVELEPLDEGHGTCVLVVEDNADVGKFATQSLNDLGYVSVYAPSAEHALAELEKDASRFDIVFSDIVMPGMSGLEMAQVIRSRYHDLPVVLTSGYSHVLAQNGSYGFELLHKPYSVEQLSHILRKALGWRRQQRSS